MKNKISPELVDRYLKGNCSPEEELLLLELYSSFDDEADPTAYLTEDQKQRIKERMFRNIRSNIEDLDAESQPVKSSGVVRRLLFAAASVAAVILIVFSVLNLQQDARPGTNINANSSHTEVANHSGQIQKHIFPDGSVVWLQPHARISYNKSFNKKLRELSLKGEAFFYVAKNPAKPFLIHAKDIDVKVLGTSFNVKTADNTNSVVSVLTGKVLVSKQAPDKDEKHASVYLLPKEKAVYSPSKEELGRETASGAELGMWKKSSLSFNDTPVSEVVATLNQNFEARISVADESINKYTLKADFTGVNLPSVLEILEKALNVRYELKNGEILLKKN